MGMACDKFCHIVTALIGVEGGFSPGDGGWFLPIN
jgi:hypothetical protein